MTFTRIEDEFLPRFIKGKNLSAQAVALHVTTLLECVARVNDGVIDDASVALVATQLRLRKRRYVIEELVSAGVWTDLGAGRYQLDWTHQKTADQVLRDDKNNQKRQTDFRERDSRCKSGDHGMCVGTKRLCQTSRNGVTATPLSNPVLSRPTKDEDKDQEKDRVTSAGARTDGTAVGPKGPPPPAASPRGSTERPRSKGTPERRIQAALEEAYPDEPRLQELIDLATADEEVRRWVMAADLLEVVPAKGNVEIRLKPKYYKLWKANPEDPALELAQDVVSDAMWVSGDVRTGLRGKGFVELKPNSADGDWPVRIVIPDGYTQEYGIECIATALQDTSANAFVWSGYADQLLNTAPTPAL